MQKEFRHNTPLFSQYHDIKNKKWKTKGCGIVALKMILLYYKPDAKITTPQLISRAVTIGGFLKNVGWKHKELAKLSSGLGLYGKNFDWAQKTYNIAVKNLISFLRDGPVIASLKKNLRKKSGGHLVIITGFNKSFVFINDPNGRTAQTIQKRIPWQKFSLLWKRRIIVIRPQYITNQRKIK